MSNIVCLAGMHRSGTSLTSSWLQRCELEMVPFGSVQSKFGNKRGLWEDKEFVNLHQQIIQERFPNSSGWLIFKKLRFGPKALQSIGKILEKRMKYPSWGWKDPRTMHFLFHWKEIIPELKVIGVWRPYRDVVNSLLKRANTANQAVDDTKHRMLDQQKAIRLWLFANQTLIEYIHRYPEDTLLFRHSDIIHQDHQVFEMINRQLKVNLTYKPIGDLYETELMTAKKSRIDSRWKYLPHFPRLLRTQMELKKYSFNFHT